MLVAMLVLMLVGCFVIAGVGASVVAFTCSISGLTMKDLGLGGITGLTGGSVDPRTSGLFDFLPVVVVVVGVG